MCLAQQQGEGHLDEDEQGSNPDQGVDTSLKAANGSGSGPVKDSADGLAAEGTRRCLECLPCGRKATLS